MSDGVSWNQGELTEETRNMVIEAGQMASLRAAFTLLDDIARPNHVLKKYRNDHLIRGLRNMVTDFQLSGNDDYAECVILAIEELGGQLNPDK